MWSKTGREYSGRIAHTCTGVKCVQWSNKLDTLRKDLNLFSLASEGILDKFPDRSFTEASDYCRNPTRDRCGPWCYTSYIVNSKGYCCVPDCTAANKGNNKLNL